MIIFILAYLGGVLTIVSPCILPVLPFVFARADQPFMRRGLPLLVGMAATFALIATLAAVGGGWAVQANEYGRWVAIVLLSVFGITLLLPSIADRLTRPLVALGSRLSQSADQSGERGGIVPSLLLVSPRDCYGRPAPGPVLGLILTGAALNGASVQTTFLLLAYALGAATSLALALVVGGRVFSVMKRSLGAGEWIRRGLGVAVLAAVVVIALGLDTGFLTSVSLASTSSLEQNLVDTLHSKAKTKTTEPQPSAPASADTGTMPAGDATKTGAESTAMNANPNMGAKPTAQSDLPVEGNLPSLSGATTWLNSPPLTPESLKGKVVLVDFWTYSCINCLRSLPYVRAWAEKYKDQGLVVIGVHAPEFAFEKNLGNVKKAIADLKIDYPVAVDNDYSIWQAFRNEYWPADYIIDAQGRIRDHQFGEGDYAGTEHSIQLLLAEAGKANVANGFVDVKATGAEAAADKTDVKSPETYVGYERAENFISLGGAVHDKSHVYAVGTPNLNQWGLAGDWTVSDEHAKLNRKDGTITYRFHARDLHLVLGPSRDGKPIRFHVTVDGAAPGDNHGVDIDATGQGTVTDQRLYQLVRQNGAIGDRTFEIKFLDPGVEAYAFTFG